MYDDEKLFAFESRDDWRRRKIILINPHCFVVVCMLPAINSWTSSYSSLVCVCFLRPSKKCVQRWLNPGVVQSFLTLSISHIYLSLLTHSLPRSVCKQTIDEREIYVCKKMNAYDGRIYIYIKKNLCKEIIIINTDVLCARFSENWNEWWSRREIFHFLFEKNHATRQFS